MKKTRTGRLPAIVLGEEDHGRLLGLATAVLDTLPEVADELLSELDRASVVPAAAVPKGAVRMGSTVTFEADGKARTVTLVYPGAADIASGRISVLTPIGAALIGLSKGQRISWTTRDGRRHELAVTEVRNP